MPKDKDPKQEAQQPEGQDKADQPEQNVPAERVKQFQSGHDKYHAALEKARKRGYTSVEDALKVVPAKGESPSDNTPGQRSGSDRRANIDLPKPDDFVDPDTMEVDQSAYMAAALERFGEQLRGSLLDEVQQTVGARDARQQQQALEAAMKQFEPYITDGDDAEDFRQLLEAEIYRMTEGEPATEREIAQALERVRDREERRFARRLKAQDEAADGEEQPEMPQGAPASHQATPVEAEKPAVNTIRDMEQAVADRLKQFGLEEVGSST